jgi:phage gp16-like protein
MSIQWTPERTAKFKATMKAKRAKGWKPAKPKPKAKAQAKPAAKQMPRVWQEKSNGAHAVHDAIGWLRYAEESATRRLRDGQLKRYDESHIYLVLALRALEGGK